MFSYTPPTSEYVNVAPLHEGASIGNSRSQRVVAHITMTGLPRDSVRVGRTIYPFRRQLVERIGTSFYSLDGFFPHLFGEGKSAEAARSDFEDKLHVAFQEVVSTIDFDRNEEQQRQWALFSSLIDLAAYDQSRSVTMTQIGCVETTLRAGCVKVRWASGVAQNIEVKKAVPEFAALSVGQWFEAVVRKTYLNDKLLAVEHVARMRPPVYTKDDRQQFWNSVLQQAH